MIPADNPPSWTQEDREALVAALGTEIPALLERLAWLRDQQLLWAKHRPEFESVATGLGDAFAADADRLLLGAKSLERVVDALSGLSPVAHGMVGQSLGPDWLMLPKQWLEAVRRVSERVSALQRGRGRPWTDPRFLAEEVARELAAHDITPTPNATGPFARVLGIMLGRLGFEDADEDGLVKAVVKSLR